MSNHKELYHSQAEQYDRLVSREDYQGNILRALQELRPFAGLDVVELGAGTGRLTGLLAPLVGHILAFDASTPMLKVAATQLSQIGRSNYHLAAADHRRLPIDSNSADLTIAGWTLCYLTAAYEATWREQLGQALAEMKRALRPGGTLIILETLGTGYERPWPPEPLKSYYAYLEEAGFSTRWIRTDYHFDSLAEAEKLTRFFFGESLAQRVAREKLTILPECTGVWWLRKR